MDRKLGIVEEDRMLRIARLFVVISFSATAFVSHATQPFRVKGLELGQPPSVACAGAKVSSEFDDAIQTLNSAATPLATTNINECHLKAASFGGLPLSGDIDVLFIDQQLFQVKFHIQPMHWLEYAKIFDPLEKMYGAPQVKNANGFTTHSWKQAESSLSISRYDVPDGIESLEILLRDEKLWSLYEERLDKVQKVLDDDKLKRTNIDIRE